MANGKGIWGVLIGGGATSVTPLLIQLLTESGSKWRKHRSAIGLGVGAVVGGALFAFKKTRDMGKYALVSAGAAGVPRAAEDYISQSQALEGSPIQGLAALGVVTAQEASLYGAHLAGRAALGQGNGAGVEVLGVTTAERAGLLGPAAGGAMGDSVEVLGTAGSFGANPASIAGWR